MNSSTFIRLFYSIAFTSLLLFSSAAHAALVAYWKFDEGSGTSASDSSGSNNNGTLNAIPGGAVPTWVAGHTGAVTDKALQFAQGVVTVPDTASLHITNTFTVAAWIKDSGSNYGHIFVSGDGTAGTRKWLLQTSNSGGDSAYFWSTTNGNFQRKLNFIPTLNTWRHVAVTYDGSAMKSYVDGALVSTINFSSALSAWGPNLYLGGVGGVNGSGFNGTMDDMVIFNSVENVTSIMNGTHPTMVPLVWTGGGTLNGSGQLVWTSAANWGGATMAAGNTLTFATSTGLTSNYNDFANNSQFTGIVFNANAGAFTLNGNTINLTGDVVNNSASAQTIANNLVLDGGTRTFNTASGNVTVNNGITQAAGQTNGLMKSGANTLTLAGTSSYTGATSVNAGKLLLSGATLGNTTTTVSGSTAILAGNGTVTGAVTAQTSGHLAPGVDAATTGTLALNGGLTLNAANLDIKAAAPGTNDAVVVTGNLTLTGNTQVNLTSQLAGFGIGDYVILTYTGTLTGSASQILAPPQDANFSYAIQTTGNQIKLHVAAATSVTYYVSQSAGNDTNNGLSSATPWKTLTKASSVTLNAGDSILLKAGDTWTGEELQPKGSGTAGNPIYIGSYGAGNKPLIDRLDYTQDRSGIHLINQAGYKIVGIEFNRCMTGIYAEYSVGSPNRNYLWIEDCYFHDSLHYQHYEDYPTRKIGLGICLFSHETANNIVLSDITVKNCTFRRLASGIWTNSPDNFAYFADNIWNFENLNIIGCLFEEGYQWQLGLRGVSGGQVTNCVTHDIGRLNNFVSFNGVAGAMMYRLKNFTFTDSEWGFVSRGGGSFDGEAFDLEGNNLNMTFTRCLFHDTAGPCFMFFKGSNANPSNTGNLFVDCVWNGKAYDCPYSQYPKVEIFNASPGSATATFTSSRFYLSTNESRANNNTGLTFTNCLTRNLSDAATGTNVALALTSSSSSQQVGFEPTKGNDGNTASVWRPSSSANEWLQIDFASPTVVNEFRLREEAGSAINRYTIQYWDSTTSTWVGCFNGRTMGTNFIAPIVTRTTTKVRLLVGSTTSGTPGIAEFEAYYVAIPPPPSTAYWRVGDGVWDINTTNNWKDTGGTPRNYVDGDIINLDDTATGTSPITLTLNTTVAPTSMTASATKNYTITGSGSIGGSCVLTKSGSGTLTLSETNTYTGGTNITGGILSFGAAANLPTSGVILGGGTLEFSGSGSAGTYALSASGGSAYLVNVTNASGTLTVTRAHGNYNGLTKTGAGTLILANNNQDAGGVQVDGGTLTLSGTSNNPINYSTTNTVSDVKPGATLKLGNTQVGLIYYDGGTFHMSGGTFDVNGQNPAADQNHSAPVVSGSGTITNSVAATTGTALFKIGGNKTFSGNITDGAGSAKVAITITSGGSTWTLSGNNTYSGATTISSGIIQAGSNTAFSPNSAYTIASGKTLDLNGFSNAIGSLTGAGNVTLGTGTLTIGADGTTPAAFTGVISGGTGGALIKTGAGTLTLGGGNSYSGGTTVSQGTLLVTNAAGTGPISVSSGGTLAGNSVIGASTTISGTHAPGSNGVGIQTFSNGLAYTVSGHLQWQLTDNVTSGRGTSFDAINVNSGTFAIATGAVLDIAVSGAVNFTNTFWDTTRTWTITDLGAGVTGSGGTETFTIGTITGGNYNVSEGTFSVSRLADGSGKNDVVLTWTPYSYDVWKITNITNINAAADNTPDGDHDKDGNNNLTEFAYGSDPLNGSSQSKIFVKTADDLGNPKMILTIAVRINTPAFTGSPSPTATADGITYTIEGATTIGTWTVPVLPITPAATATLPPPTSGYEYRSFTLSGSSGLPGSGFLRAKVAKP